MISQARLKFLRSLRRKKVRAEEGLLLVEGLNVIEEATAAGRVRELFVAADNERTDALIDRGLPVSRLHESDVATLTDTKTPVGTFALVENPCGELAAGDLADAAFVLVAAGVADPGNLGTLVRTAAALGVDAVVTTAGTVEPTNPKVVRATAGALFRVPVWRGEAATVREAGFDVFVADAGGPSVDQWTARPPRLALVVGNEPRGVAESVHALAQGAVGVPLHGGVESLNVAIAAGILMHALGRLPVVAR